MDHNIYQQCLDAAESMKKSKYQTVWLLSSKGIPTGINFYFFIGKIRSFTTGTEWHQLATIGYGNVIYFHPSILDYSSEFIAFCATSLLIHKLHEDNEQAISLLESDDLAIKEMLVNQNYLTGDIISEMRKSFLFDSPDISDFNTARLQQMIKVLNTP